MKEYTTSEVADIVDDISLTMIRTFVNTHLKEGEEYNKYGRTIMVTEAGLERIKNRNTKPGRPRGANGSVK